MIPQLLQPPLHIIVCLVFTDIIHKQRTNGSPVIGWCDGTVAFLPRCVPDLGFDSFGIDLDGAGCKFDPNGGFGVEVEFIASKSWEQVRFTDTTVPNENHWGERVC